MDQTHIDTFKQQFTGVVITSTDSSYEQVRSTYGGEGTPALVVQPKINQDVALAIALAEQTGLVLSVRSGGHSGAGHGTNNGGIVIDLSPLNTVTILDVTKHIVRIGGGALWGDVAKALAGHRLAISSGDTKSVGVGGLTLTGGIGWMVRKYGLALDSLVAVELVTAGGKILRASASENSDLFWAVRGGGGNFGVITSFEFAAHPLGEVYASKIQFKLDNLSQFLKKWRDYMRTADENLDTTLLIMPGFGDNPPALQLQCCYGDNNEANANTAIEPLLQLGEVIKNDIEKKAYVEVLEEAHSPHGLKIVTNNAFVSDFSDKLIDELALRYGKSTSPMLMIRSLGGALNKIPADATAFAHRNSEVLLVSASFLPLTTTDEQVKTLMEAWDSLQPYFAGAYANFFTQATEKEIVAIYPQATYDRLADIKARYDPQNLFNQNYNIKPSG